MKKILNKTNGKKTPTVAILWLAFKLAKLKWPALENYDEIVETIIISLFSGTIGHKLIRNFRYIWEYLKKLILWKKGKDFLLQIKKKVLTI